MILHFFPELRRGAKERRCEGPLFIAKVADTLDYVAVTSRSIEQAQHSPVRALNAAASLVGVGSPADNCSEM